MISFHLECNFWCWKPTLKYVFSVSLPTAHQICRDEPTLLDSCLQMKHDTDSFNSKPCVDNFNLMKFNCPKTCKICQVCKSFWCTFFYYTDQFQKVFDSFNEQRRRQNLLASENVLLDIDKLTLWDINLLLAKFGQFTWILMDPVRNKIKRFSQFTLKTPKAGTNILKHLLQRFLEVLNRNPPFLPMESI